MEALAGGCHLNRDVPALLQSGGSRTTEMQARYLKGPKFMTWFTQRTAVAA